MAAGILLTNGYIGAVHAQLMGQALCGCRLASYKALPESSTIGSKDDYSKVKQVYRVTSQVSFLVIMINSGNSDTPSTENTAPLARLKIQKAFCPSMLHQKAFIGRAQPMLALTLAFTAIR